MNHIANIAKKLPEYGLDAMLITSPPGSGTLWASMVRVCSWSPGTGPATPPTVGISRPLGSRSWERRYL